METRVLKPKYAVTHPGKPHPDDMLCGAIERFLYGDVKIYRRDPTEEELNDPRVHVFDVGKILSYRLNVYDHHQNQNQLPASCRLLWDRLVKGRGREARIIKDTIRATIINPISDADVGMWDSESKDLSLSEALSSFIKYFPTYDEAYEAGVDFLEKMLRGKVKKILNFHNVDWEWSRLKLYGNGKIKLIEKRLDFLPAKWLEAAKKEGVKYLLLKEHSREKLPMLYSLNGMIPLDKRQRELIGNGMSAVYKTFSDAQNHALELVL